MTQTGIHTIDPTGVRDIAPDVLGDDGQVKVMPAAYYAGVSAKERSVFCVRHGVYCLPTIELIEFLKEAIGDRDAIEIGAGNGVIAAALGIRATDNRMQDTDLVRAYYGAIDQATVKYGENVEKLSARDAVRKYKPAVVVAAWVTHKYDQRRHEAGGNEFGVDESDVLKNCEQYMFVGNTQVHRGKEIWSKKPALDYPSWLYSRALNGSPDFVAIWEGGKARHA
jgi:hypothetical protein